MKASRISDQALLAALAKSANGVTDCTVILQEMVRRGRQVVLPAGELSTDTIVMGG